MYFLIFLVWKFAHYVNYLSYFIYDAFAEDSLQGVSGEQRTMQLRLKT